MTCFAPLGLALIVAMQSPTAESATATSVPDLNLAVDGKATDEDPDDRSPESQRARRDAGADAPREIPDSDAADERPQDRDRAGEDRPRRRSADGADRRPRIRDRAGADRPPRRRSDSDVDVANDRPNARDTEGERQRVTVIQRLKHVPAKDTATTIAEWIDLESKLTDQNPPTVVPVVISNSLMVTGEPRQVREIDWLVRQLDQLPAQVQVKALLVSLSLPEDTADVSELGPFQGGISEIVTEMRQRGEVRVLAQADLLAGDNQPAFVMVGNRVPRITATTTSSRGRLNSVQLENVGTTVGVTARVADDERIALEIDVERSHLGPQSEGTPLAAREQEDVPRAQHVETVTVQTTATLRSGETAVLGGLVSKDERGRGQVLVLVQPTIVVP